MSSTTSTSTTTMATSSSSTRLISTSSTTSTSSAIKKRNLSPNTLPNNESEEEWKTTIKRVKVGHGLDANPFDVSMESELDSGYCDNDLNDLTNNFHSLKTPFTWVLNGAQRSSLFTQRYLDINAIYCYYYHLIHHFWLSLSAFLLTFYNIVVVIKLQIDSF